MLLLLLLVDLSRAKSGLQGFLLCTAQGTIEYFGIPPKINSFVTRAFVAFYSLHLLYRVEVQISAPCVSRLPPPPIAVALGTVTATALSTSSTVVLSASDLSPRRRTLHSHHPTHVNTGRTANTACTHYLTNAWSYTVTRSCRSSHEAWQQ